MAEVARTLKAFEETAAFLARLDSHSIYLLQAFVKIMDNDRGCTTPVEEFISDLVWHWAKEDEDGQGLTLEQIESEVETLRKGQLSEEIRNAHWMASRFVGGLSLVCFPDRVRHGTRQRTVVRALIVNMGSCHDAANIITSRHGRPSRATAGY
jgi:hypothetical protein